MGTKVKTVFLKFYFDTLRTRLGHGEGTLAPKVQKRCTRGAQEGHKRCTRGEREGYERGTRRAQEVDERGTRGAREGNERCIAKPSYDQII